MMQSVSIDAGVLAVPRPEEGSEKLHVFVDALLDWRRLLNEPWVSVHLSERASELLVEEGLYPLREALRDAFKTNGIIEYDVNTVAQVAERLLRLTPSFEAYFRVRDVLVENLETDPPLLSLTIGQHMALDLGRCVVLMALLRHHCRRVDENISLIVRHCPASGQIFVRAEIHDIDHERNDMEAVPVAPECFEGTILACHDFNGFLSSIDEVSAWKTAADDVGKTVAIQIAVYKSRLIRGLQPEWDDSLRFSFGTRFLEFSELVCRANPDDLIPKMLRCVTETVDQLNLNATHPLRQNQSGGAPQRVRGKDNAKAWRRDIDYEYHLHYWERADGTVELASMGPHNDFAIPE